MSIITWIAIYFISGIMALCVLDMLTKRIRSRLKDAAYDTQSKMLTETKTMVGRKSSILLTVCALLILWPAPVLGAIYDWIRGSK